MRQIVERAIARRFMTDAIKAGYRIAVSLERGFDTEDMLLGSTDIKKIMEEAFSGDECHLFVQPKDGPVLEGPYVVSIGWVYLVFGNDGYDVVSDYTTSLEFLMGGVRRLEKYYGA